MMLETHMLKTLILCKRVSLNAVLDQKVHKSSRYLGCLTKMLPFVSNNWTSAVLLISHLRQ